MNTIRLASALLLALYVALSSASVSAQTSTPPDVIRLRDGTFLRGTIVERSAAQVVVILQTGETRTYPADVVDFAGPDVPPGPALVQAPLVTTPPTARLHVQSRQPELSLQRVQGSASVTGWAGGRGLGHARFDNFAIVCNAPCDIEIPEGTYQLGVAQGTGSAQRAGRPMDLRGELTLALTYDDRSGERAAGWATFIIGPLGGGALFLGGIYMGDIRSGIRYDETNIPVMIAGAVVVGVSMIVGLVYAAMNDGATIDATF